MYLASNRSPPPPAGGSQSIPPISSPWGSILGIARQTAPLTHTGLRLPPALELAPLPLPTSTLHRLQVEPRRSHRHRAQGARCSVSRAKPPRLTHTGLEAPALWHVPRSLSIRHPPMGFRWILAGPTDIEPRGLDDRFRALSACMLAPWPPLF
jgi:hypothetical protein